MVEAMAVLRIVRAINTISVQRSGFDFRQIAVPNLIGVLRQYDTPQLAIAARIEDTQFDFFCVFGEEREIHAAAVPRCAQRVRTTRENGRANEWSHAIDSNEGASITAPSGGSVSSIEWSRP